MPLPHDVVVALRGMRRRPGLSLVVVLTLALGLGAVIAVFSIVDSVLLRPLPYAHANRLVWVGTRGARDASPVGPSMRVAGLWRSRARSLEAQAVYTTETKTLAGADAPRRVSATFVSGSFFPLLGIAPEMGRLLGTADDREDAPPVAVLGDSLWRTAFHADPRIIGRTITLGDLSAQAVGVLPPRASFPGSSGVWLAIQPTLGTVLGAPQVHAEGMLARLRPGVGASSAQMELQALLPARESAATEAGGAGRAVVTVVPLRSRIAGDARTPLLLVLGASVLVLVLACVNVAGMLLARGAARSRELAVRLALGASRRRVVAALLTECALHALAGVALGVAMAECGVRLAARLGATLLPRATEIEVHGDALAVGIALGVLATLLAGLAPALQTTRGAPADALRGGAGHASTSRAGVRFREGLVVLEVALTLVLLAGAGVLARSVALLLGGSLGIHPEHVLVANVMRPLGEWPTNQEPMRAFGDALVRELDAQHGVRASAVALNAPAARDPGGYVREAPDGDSLAITWQVVTPGYFRVLGIPVLRGRTFAEQDGPTGAPTLILSRAVAARLFPHANPVGRRVYARSNDDVASSPLAAYEIVGIAGDVRPPGPARSAIPTVYIPFRRVPVPHMTVLVRTDAPPGAAAKMIERVVHALDPAQPVSGVRPLDALLAEAAARPRFYLALLAAFAAAALLLAAVGLYGLLAFSVRQRTREIGIRRALGAPPRRVLRAIVGRALALTLAGVAVGLAGAWMAMRLLAGAVGTAGALDPAILGAGGVLLGAVALLASIIPARQALAVDPTVALRVD